MSALFIFLIFHRFYRLNVCFVVIFPVTIFLTAPPFFASALTHFTHRSCMKLHVTEKKTRQPDPRKLTPENPQRNERKATAGKSQEGGCPKPGIASSVDRGLPLAWTAQAYFQISIMIPSRNFQIYTKI
ncbi:hypothetical protein RvY_17731 [Ramazzottius varieornatus]|uniref:Uncharacterized protein n=1 Tax=Ramazzottius varieornatus TaxID=947166 RepID=A0A1D1W6W8_RAMVA|nr:hypothetical protein RvY_17731 [Ramazzottius varieornatus]